MEGSVKREIDRTTVYSPSRRQKARLMKKAKIWKKAWCPEKYRAEYGELTKQFPVSYARKLIRERVKSEREQ